MLSLRRDRAVVLPYEPGAAERGEVVVRRPSAVGSVGHGKLFTNKRAELYVLGGTNTA